MKLRVILGPNDSKKLTLSQEMPATLEKLKEEIQKQCGLKGEFRLQYLDSDLSEFINLDSTAELEDKGTIKVIPTNIPVPLGTSTPEQQSPSHLSSCSPSVSQCDTEILSSNESTNSSDSSRSTCSSFSRTSTWPLNFPVPRFPFDAELELQRANDAYLKNGTLLNPEHKLRCAILKGLNEEIIKYKMYPDMKDFEDVASALVRAHPCLKEPGSPAGIEGWKISLQWKLGNFRRTLRSLNTPEVMVNSLKNKPEGKATPAYKVKKPRRAEANFCPDYPPGETRDSLEELRLCLLVELKKRHNEETIKNLMEKTYSLRRYEIVNEEPMIINFKERWPALFNVNEIEAEFNRITNVHLISRFFARLDSLTESFVKVFKKKGGSNGRKLRLILERMAEVDSIAKKREGILRGLCIYLNEDPDDLFREFVADAGGFPGGMSAVPMAVFLITHEGADPSDNPEDIGIFMEGVEILDELQSVPHALAWLFGLTYALMMKYPPTHTYTFEAVQKIIMQIDDRKMSKKIQTLSNKLSWQSN